MWHNINESVKRLASREDKCKTDSNEIQKKSECAICKRQLGCLGRVVIVFAMVVVVMVRIGLGGGLQ
jgi:hypothetical protein